MRRPVWLFLLSLVAALSLLLNGCMHINAAQSTPQESSEGVLSVSSEPDAPYKTQIQYAQRDGNRIYGIIYIPENAGKPMPAVIFSHGFGGTHTAGAQYAEILAENGYVVYCFDFCGGSPSSQSDGSPLEMSLFTEQADLEAVISMVQELDYVDNENLFLMGTSQGGAVSAITAALSSFCDGRSCK